MNSKIRIWFLPIILIILVSCQNSSQPEEGKKPRESIEKSKAAIAQFENGMKLYHKQDYLAAINKFSQAINLYPDYVEAYYYRGNSQSYLKSYRGSIADYSKAIELDPDNISLYEFRGNARVFIEEYQGAIADFSRVIEAKPDVANAYKWRANARSKSGDYDGAIADYNRVLELNPDEVESIFMLAILYHAQKKYKEAKDATARALEIDPKSPVIHYNMGFFCLANSDFEEAVGYLEYYLEHGEKMFRSDALVRLSIAYYLSDNKAAAAKKLDLALKASPSLKDGSRVLRNTEREGYPYSRSQRKTFDKMLTEFK